MDNKKIALITGISGQDGLYLARLLIKNGYKVYGTSRVAPSNLRLLSKAELESIKIFEWDMLNEEVIKKIISLCRPSEIYNLAAFSSGLGMFDNPIGIGLVNGMAPVHILESIRGIDPTIKFCQASSREVFGEALESPQNENTVRNPRSPYGSAKLYAYTMINIYRKSYNIFCCSAILYNHESPLRGYNFVTRKISNQVAKIALGISSELKLGNLETERDWGFSGDYVRALWLMLNHAHPDDYIIATGIKHTVRDFCEMAFNIVDLDYRDFVVGDDINYRNSEPRALVGDCNKIKTELNWRPEVDFYGLVSMMVLSDLDNIKSELN